MNKSTKDQERLDIVKLINNSPLTNISGGFQSILIERIQKSFTDDEQQVFVASFYSYLNYNSKTDFVINLDDVWKWCGFTRRDNARRILNKHFLKDTDYKIVFNQLKETIIFTPQSGGANLIKDNRGGHNKETVLMTVNTFKKFCLKAGTKRADEIHDYYLKLEELLQDILQEQLQEQERVLKEQEQRIKLLEHKPHTFGFSCWRSGYIYLINDVSKPGHYKIGMATDTTKRVRNLNTASSERSLQLYYDIETYDAELCERTIQNILQPFNIRGRREWFFFEDETKLKYCIHIMNRVKEFLDTFNFTTPDDFLEYVKNKTLPILPNQNLKRIPSDTINETNIYKLTGQQMSNKTGKYKGTCFSEEKKKWKSELKRDYVNYFLGYYDTELEAAKAYNDYAIFVNQKHNTNYELNDIQDYESTPRDIPSLSKQQQLENKTSRYTGISYDSNRNYFCICIKYKRKTYHLGNGQDQTECAKIYNQQALYLNNHFGTKYNLNQIDGYITEEKNYIIFDDNTPNPKKINTSSRFYGVTFSKQRNKYRSYVVYNKRQINIGFFDDERDAAIAYNDYVTELNKTNKRQYKLNTII